MTDEGASSAQVALGAARSDNLSLLRDTITSSPDADFVSTTRDAIGNTLLHVACKHGSLESVDFLLDQEGLELDLANRLDGDTALHLACRFARDTDAEIGREMGRSTRFYNSRELEH